MSNSKTLLFDRYSILMYKLIKYIELSKIHVTEQVSVAVTL